MTTSQISDGSQAVQDLFSDADYVAKQLYQVRGYSTVGELFRPRNELPLDWTPEELAHRGIRQGDAFYLVQLAPMYAAVWTGRYLQTQLYQPVRPDEVDRYMWKLLGIGGAYRVQVR